MNTLHLFSLSTNVLLYWQICIVMINNVFIANEIIHLYGRIIKKIALDENTFIIIT